MEKRVKKGVSPVIATVLLIAMVIVLAAIVFLWARGFIKEAVQKKGTAADQACDQISLTVLYSGATLQITNNGNIPVYSFEIRKQSGASIDKEHVEERLLLGKTWTKEIGSYDKIEIVPAILGTVKNSQNTIYTCTKTIIEAETSAEGPS